MHHQLYLTEVEPIKIRMMIAVSTWEIKLSDGIVDIHHITPGHVEPALGTII